MWLSILNPNKLFDFGSYEIGLVGCPNLSFTDKYNYTNVLIIYE